MSGGKRFGLLAAVVAVAVVAFLIAKPGGDDNETKTSTTTTPGATAGTDGKPAKPKPQYVQIRVEGGKPVGGVERIKVDKGERVRFAVTSDVADEVHVHGYDYMRDVSAGGTVKFNFAASIDGSFEIELENRQEQIAELEVQP